MRMARHRSEPGRGVPDGRQPEGRWRRAGSALLLALGLFSAASVPAQVSSGVMSVDTALPRVQQVALADPAGGHPAPAGLPAVGLASLSQPVMTASPAGTQLAQGGAPAGRALAAGSGWQDQGAGFDDSFKPVPPLRSPVTDTAGMLQPGERQVLVQKLLQLEAQKGSQVAVLTVKTTQPETIEEYSLRVVEAWKLGRGKGGASGQEVDDGVLLLIARDDRRARIEVGYGLEGAIPDGMAKRIIDQQLVPHFRQQQYFAGIQAAVDSIIARVNDEELPLPADTVSTEDLWLDDLLPLMFFMTIGGIIASGIIGRFLAGLAAGGVMGFSALGVLGSLATSVVCGLIVMVIVLVVASTGHSLQQVGRRTYRGGRGGGFGGGLGGGIGGGFGGGGFGGGGGFSGGGGGFGGGGASGGW